MTMPTQGDLLKELGIARVKAAEQDAWKMLFRIYATQFFRSLYVGQEFRGEAVREYVEATGLGPPHHPNVWSAMLRSVLAEELRSGRIERCGTSKTSRPCGHSREAATYRRIPQ